MHILWYFRVKIIISYSEKHCSLMRYEFVHLEWKRTSYHFYYDAMATSNAEPFLKRH